MAFSRNSKCLKTNRGLLSVAVNSDASNSSGDFITAYSNTPGYIAVCFSHQPPIDAPPQFGRSSSNFLNKLHT